MNLFKALFSNSRALPQTHRYFVRHIKEDLVRYPDGLYYVPEETLRNMDKTFSGKPVYVRHIDSENDSDERINDKVGDVVKSFYNEFDGWHWAEILVDDEGQSLFNKGWTVSNGHRPSRIGGGGVHNNQKYDHTVDSSEYEHLAITDSPRYEGALVFTPDEFKAYNEEKDKEIQSLKNSKENEMDEEQIVKLGSLIAAEVVKGLSLKNSAEKKEAEKDKKKESLTNSEESLVKDAAFRELLTQIEELRWKEGDEKPAEEIVKEIYKKISESGLMTSEIMANEEVHKREEIDDVGGFLKAKGLSDEDIRIVMAKMGKASYEKSEAGTADNEKEEEEKDNEGSKAEKPMTNEVEESSFSVLKNAKKQHFINAEPVMDTTAAKLARGAERYGL